MTIKALVARQQVDGYFLRVHLDDTKLLADGVTPDPVYVREFRFGLTPPGALTAAQWRTQIAAEVKLLAQDALSRIAPGAGSALPIEGQAL